MNIWGLLFIIILLLWLFIEYLRYVKNKIAELFKDYKKSVEMRKELETFINKNNKE